MWKCHKCGKPVYFAERKQSLGFDWHPNCLRCEECGKRLNPGQHAEHKGVPYCHVPCYGALFGPQLFGHGTRVESHSSFGKPNSRSGTAHSLLEQKLKEYNSFYDGKSCEIRSRLVNGRLVLEGALRIYWGVIGMIHLKEDDDQRTVVTIRKRNSCRYNSQDEESDIEGDVPERITLDKALKINDESNDGIKKQNGNASVNNHDDSIENGTSSHDNSYENGSKEINSNSANQTRLTDYRGSSTLPGKLQKPQDWDELDDLLQVERKIEPTGKPYQTMSGPLQVSSSLSSQQDSGILSDSSSIDEKTLVDDISSSTSGDTTPSSDVTDTDGYSSAFERTMESNTITRSISGPDALYFDGIADDSASLSQKISRVLRSLSTPEDLKSGLIRDDSFNYVDKSIPPGTFPYDDSLKRYLNASYTSPQASEIDPPIVLRRQRGNAAIKRRAGRRRERGALRRRCSINGHFYNRDTSFFTPPHGCQTSVWVTSLVGTSDVIAQLLDKYKVDSLVNNFALFVVRDNGEQRRLREDEYPLEVRVMLGPHEDVARIFLMDARSTQEISSEVAQFLNLSIPECRNILERYQDEEEREAKRIRLKYREMRKRIKDRMEELKVRL